MIVDHNSTWNEMASSSLDTSL